jgi:pimeloyl-ACP methyl ester carboxylesterase
MTLHVRAFGEPGARPFVFWHALGPDFSSEYFGDVAGVLAARGFDVYGIDGPGFGASPLLDPEEYRLDALARQLWETADGLRLERPVLAGHSWGGAVVVTAAAQRPADVAAVVLFDSGHIDYVSLDDVEPDRPLEDWIAEVEARPDPRNTEVRAYAMRGMTDSVSTAWPILAEHSIPTLLLLATAAPHVEINRAHIGPFESAMPHAEIRWVEDAGHGIVQDVGAPLGDELAAWLAVPDS